MSGALLRLADMGWGSHMGDWGAGWWILMTLGMVVFWGLVILGIVWLVRSLGGDHQGHAGGSALEILDRRLASGEISPDDYRERRAHLRGENTEDDGTRG
jgi:putative membrane protein